MSKKLIYSTTAALTIVGSLGLSCLSFQPTNAAETNPSTSSTTADTELINSLVDENVYVFADASGKTTKTISSDWTKNSLGLDEYKKTEKSVSTPISLSIEYLLDGQKISPADLSGKSGKVTIRYAFTNHDRKNGYLVPYAVVSGLTLDNDHFKNIEVKNAKIFNDGSKTIVTGFALPGLQEDLGVSDIDIPSSFTITADATDFQLGMGFSVTTSEVFKDLDVDQLGSFSDLSHSLGQLENAMNELLSGSDQLYAGLTELNDKSKTLVSGVNQLATGSTTLKAGTKALADGLTTAKSGASDLSSGLSAITANNSALTSGASQVKSGVFTLATATLQSINPAAPALTESNYTTILSDEMLNTLPTPQKTQLTQLRTLLTGTVSLSSGISAYTANVSKAASGAKDLSAGLNDASAGVNDLYAGVTTLDDGLQTLNSSTEAMQTGITKLATGSGDLKNGLSTFNEQGIKKLVSELGGLEQLSQRLKTTINLAKQSQTSTKYIYRIDEIK